MPKPAHFSLRTTRRQIENQRRRVDDFFSVGIGGLLNHAFHVFLFKVLKRFLRMLVHFLEAQLQFATHGLTDNICVSLLNSTR